MNLLVMGIRATQDAGSAFPSSGLVSYWKSDTNGSFPDAKSSNNGTIAGPGYSASGMINGCYDYDGSNDQINVNDHTSLRIAASFSISMWFKRGSLQTGMRILFGKGAVVNDENYFLSFNGNKIYGYFANTAGSWQAVPLSTNTITDTTTWHHWVMVYDTTANNITHYIDDSNWTSGTVSGTPRTGNYKLSIGSSSTNNRYFDGKIDEIGIWNRVLTSSEITALYNSGNGLPYS